MELPVPPEAAGQRLDAFLAGPLGSRSRAQRLIDAGHVLVDGTARPKRHALAGGERVTVDEPADPVGADPQTDASFALAYEDEHLLVVDKPAGVVVHPARGHASGTLAQALVPRGVAGATTRGARASCIAWTATPPGCWSLHAPRRPTAR